MQHLWDFWPLVLALLAGAGAIYLLLPRPHALPAWWGALLGAAALLLAGWTFLRVGGFSPEVVLFYVFSALAVVAGALLVTQRHPARAALSFTLVVLSVCGLFLLLAAPFLMAATIIIYAGAIIVTFLFVLMLAHQNGVDNADLRSREPLLAVLTGFLLLGTLLYVLQLSYEQNAAVKLLDQLLAVVRQRQHQPPDGESLTGVIDREVSGPLNEAVAAGESPQTTDVNARRTAQELKPVRDRVEQLRTDDDWPRADAPPEKKRAALARVEEILLRARRQHGWLPAHADGPYLSDLSGPAANEPPNNLRYDARQRPQLPADNPGYLGRALFTDYLLPVELGGFLLLVATVGSIAIAQRRSTPGGAS